MTLANAMIGNFKPSKMIQRSLLTFLTILLSSYINSSNENPPQLNNLLNKAIPHFSGYLLNGSNVDETILADKIVLLNFMFIGCQGCMQELPNLAKLHEKYINSDFMIITIMGNGIEDIKSYQGTGDTSKIFYAVRKMRKYDSIKNTIVAECKSVNKIAPPNTIITCTENISKKFLISAYPTNLLVDQSGTIKKIYHNLSDSTEYLDLQEQIGKMMEN